MSYTKQTWATGDVVTQEKMNHLEDGIANAYLSPEPLAYDNVTVLDVVLPETSINSGEKAQYNSYYEVSGIIPSIAQVKGGTYRVTYDGTEYILNDISYDYQSFIKIGNPGPPSRVSYGVSDDRFEVPFSFEYDEDTNDNWETSYPILKLVTTEGGTHTYKIELVQVDTKAFDHRLVSLPYFNLVFDYSDSSRTRTWTSSNATYTSYQEYNGRTYSDLQKAIARGQNTAILIYAGSSYPDICYVSNVGFHYDCPTIRIYNPGYVGDYIDKMINGTSTQQYNAYSVLYPYIMPDGTWDNDPTFNDFGGIPVESRVLTLIIPTYT